jgi:hypothetical protein
VTAGQYEREARLPVFVTDETVTALSTGITATRTDTRGRARTHALPGLGVAPWLQRTMGLRIREALGVRKADFKTRSDGTRYLHLCWQASENGRELEPLKHRQAGDFRDVPVPDLVWDMIAGLPDGPLCPGPHGTPYLPYSTASSRFARITGHLAISGVHTHSLRHQFASEALDANPRELANISQVLGHDSVQTTLRFYIHPSANAEQRISASAHQRHDEHPLDHPSQPPGLTPATPAVHQGSSQDRGRAPHSSPATPPARGHLQVPLITWPQEAVPAHQPWMQADELTGTVTGRPRRQHRPVMGNFARIPDQARAPGDGDPPARESPRVNNVRLIGQDNVPATRRGDHRRPPMTAEDNVAAVNHMAHQLDRGQRTIAESNPADTYGSQQAQYLMTADGHKTPVSNVRTRHTLPHPATCQQRAKGLPA